MKNNRLAWGDSLKGYLILLVVLGHAIQNTLGLDCYNDHLWNLIYSFHMPAFMAISGYFAYRPSGLGGANYVVNTLFRRFRQLVVPFLLWTVISLVIHQDFTLSSISSIILYPDYGLWFLWVLFWINVIFVIGSWFAELIRIKQEYVIITLCGVLAATMVIFEIRVLGFQFIAYYFLFYSLGYYLNKYQDRILFLNNRLAIIILFAFWIVLAWNWKMHELPQFLKQIPLPGALLQYFYRFLTAAIAVFLLVTISPKFLNDEGKWNVPFVRLGYYSLGIYAVHFIFIGIIVNLLLNELGLGQSFVIIISFIAASALSWLMVWMLSKWSVSSKWLLGKI